MKSHAVKQTAEIHSSEPLTLAKSKINHRTYILNVSHAPFKNSFTWRTQDKIRPDQPVRVTSATTRKRSLTGFPPAYTDLTKLPVSCRCWKIWFQHYLLTDQTFIGQEIENWCKNAKSYVFCILCTFLYAVKWCNIYMLSTWCTCRLHWLLLS